MRPLALKGHERSLTALKFNKEGDLLFSSSKDSSLNVWFAENGERLGTYEGHNGAIWCVDVSWDSSCVLTGSGDNFCKLWDCETGKCLNNLQASTAVRSVGFSYSGNLFFYTTDHRTHYNCMLNIFDIRDRSQLEGGAAQRSIPCPRSKITSAVWSHLDDMIITGHENGEICQYDIRSTSNDPSNFVNEHRKQIQDLQLSFDQSMVISASKDHSSKLFDAHTLEHLKTYKSERPINSASISPIRDHVVIGGGEEAMQVTQTTAGEGHFEARLFHLIFEDEFARIKGHFGPINTLSFHPDGRSMATGGEDGFVRINVFDPDYFDFEFDY